MTTSYNEKGVQKKKIIRKEKENLKKEKEKKRKKDDTNCHQKGETLKTMNYKMEKIESSGI